MSMPVRFRVYIVRHGETEWNRTRRIQGHLDVPLNESGRKQAMLAAESLKDVSFVRAFSSDLQRAYKTAESILQYHPDTVLMLDESIRERYMGELQGEFGRSNKPAPSLESAPNFIARCLAWYSGTIVDYMASAFENASPLEQTHNILVVSHGAWIVTLLSALKANGALTFCEGVELGHCFNTGLSVIEYVISPRNEAVLLGTLVQFSGIQHLLRENSHPQETSGDVLEDLGKNT